MTVLFENQGTLDPLSITTFGVSSKQNPGSIGFFGTGLKYAIAILLREGCGVRIYSGAEVLEFGVQRDRVRVDDFDFVTMNGQRLGFTTELGKTWELWQAFRELYCNCTDEGGTVRELGREETVSLEADRTKIIVTGDRFTDVFHNRAEIVLETQPLRTHEICDIHPGPSSFLFYRGMRAYTLPRKAMYAYNIKRKIDLTEDRTIKWVFEADAAVQRTLVESDDAQLIRDILTAPKGTHEHHLTFSGIVPNDTFLGEVRKLANVFSPYLNQSALEMCRPWLLEALPEPDQAEPLDPVEAARLQKATRFCRAVGFPVDEFPIVVTDWLGEEVLGRAHKGRIYLSKRAMMMGTKMVAGTLIEEYLHLRHNLRDCERSMQNFLMDTIVSLGERVVGEPL